MPGKILEMNQLLRACRCQRATANTFVHALMLAGWCARAAPDSGAAEWWLTCHHTLLCVTRRHASRRFTAANAVLTVACRWQRRYAL